MLYFNTNLGATPCTRAGIAAKKARSEMWQRAKDFGSCYRLTPEKLQPSKLLGWPSGRSRRRRPARQLTIARSTVKEAITLLAMTCRSDRWITRAGENDYLRDPLGMQSWRGLRNGRLMFPSPELVRSIHADRSGLRPYCRPSSSRQSAGDRSMQLCALRYLRTLTNAYEDRSEARKRNDQRIPTLLCAGYDRALSLIHGAAEQKRKSGYRWDRVEGRIAESYPMRRLTRILIAVDQDR